MWEKTQCADVIKCKTSVTTCINMINGVCIVCRLVCNQSTGANDKA